MKKRKSPILLVSVLIVMVLGFFFVTFPRTALNLKPTAPTPSTGEDVHVESKDEVANNVANQMKRRPGPMGEPMDTRPSIEVPKATAYKPTPNESSTSTQWYTDETPKSFNKPK